MIPNTPPQPGPKDFQAEVVLHDGRFARITRAPTAGDVIAAFQPDGNALRWCLVLTSRICTIDDKPVTAKELEDMEWLYVSPMTQMVNAYLQRLGPYMKGIS